MEKEFGRWKKQCLKKLDLSKKGSVDEAIAHVVSLINSREEFFTTSSCSGRVILIDRVRGATSADLLPEGSAQALLSWASKYQLKRMFFRRLQVAMTSRNGTAFGCLSHTRNVNLTTWWAGQASEPVFVLRQPCFTGCPVSVLQVSALERSDADAVFKFEPFVLHVQCRQLDDAQLMVRMHYKTNFWLYLYNK